MMAAPIAPAEHVNAIIADLGQCGRSEGFIVHPYRVGEIRVEKKYCS